MICDRCGKREASVFIRREGSGESALCGECARNQGISARDGRLQISLEDLFSPLPDSPDRPGYRTACAACGTRLAEVRKTGRVGCPACFESFRGDLVAFLQRRGRRGAYRGSVPRRFALSGRQAGSEGLPKPGSGNTEAMVSEKGTPPGGADLEVRLRNALAAEDYELAARIRDLLRSTGREGP